MEIFMKFSEPEVRNANQISFLEILETESGSFCNWKFSNLNLQIKEESKISKGDLIKHTVF